MAGTESFGPFDSSPWSTAQWYRFAAVWAPNGVIDAPAASASTGSFGITFSGLTPTLAAGRAWVRGGGYELAGGSKAMTAIVANTNASLSRRDRIVLRRDLNAQTIGLASIQGTPSASPTAPAMQANESGQYDIPLFSFLVPPNSGTTITGIIDERVWVDPGGVWLNGQQLLVADQTSSANATSTSPVALAGIDGKTLTLATARKLTLILHAETCQGGAGSELGRVTLTAGSASRRSQFDITRSGTAGEVSRTVIVSGTFPAGTTTINANVLRVTGGTDVTVSNAELTVLDGGQG